MTAPRVLVLALFACGDARSTDHGVAPSAVASGSSSSPPEASVPSEGSSAVAPSASAVAATLNASAAVQGGRAIAAWLDEAEMNVDAWKHKPFSVQGVFLRTWLRQSGVYVGDEHPGYRVLVVNVADARDAAPRDTLQCWTSLLAVPTELKEGDRVRVEGHVSHLAGHSGRRYLPHLSACKYTRL